MAILEKKVHRGFTSDLADTHTIAPFARKVFLIFGCIVAAYVLFVFAIDESLSFLWGVVLVSLGLISLFIYTRSIRRYYAPLIFTLFYFLGYLLDFAGILLNKTTVASIGFGAIGTFGFTDAEFAPVVFAIFVGLSAIMAATFLAEMVFPRLHLLGERGAALRPASVNLVAMRSWIWIWFVLSGSLIMLMWYLGIGRTGLQHETTLPFRLAGLLVFIKQIVVPFVGVLLLGMSLGLGRKRLTSLILWLIIAIGVIGSIAGASRGFLVFTVFPALLFMLLTSYKNDWKRKLLVRYTVAFFIIVLIVIVLVQSLRDVIYGEGQMISIYELYAVFAASPSFNLAQAVAIFSDLLVSRIGGIRELLAVSSSSVRDLYAPWAIFISDTDYLEMLLLSVFGFLPAVDEDLAFGVAFGFLGMFYLGGSYVVVFLGTLASCLFVIVVEEIFIRRRMYSGAVFFSFYLGFVVWTGIYLFFLLRATAMIGLCYLIMAMILRSLNRPLGILVSRRRVVNQVSARGDGL